MRVLLDTHALLWFFAGDNKLSQPAKTIIDDVEVTKLISIASIWEMTIKQARGKLNLETTAAIYARQKLSIQSFQLLSVEISHLEALSLLAAHHNDPFDRIMISQAISENIQLISCDQFFPNYPVQLIW
jgi:PIN domain nuclease of toxin-antitoxin system